MTKLGAVGCFLRGLSNKLAFVKLSAQPTATITTIFSQVMLFTYYKLYSALQKGPIIINKNYSMLHQSGSLGSSLAYFCTFISMVAALGKCYSTSEKPSLLSRFLFEAEHQRRF